MVGALKLAKGAPHRALGDARLVKALFLTLLQRAPYLRKVADLARFVPPLTFAEGPVVLIDPPAGFEPLALSLAAGKELMMVYERGVPRAEPRKITPRILMQVHGVAYVVAYCHLDGSEKTFRLDRIHACWLAEGGK